MSYKMRTKVVVTAGLCAALTLTGASVALAEVGVGASTQEQSNSVAASSGKFMIGKQSYDTLQEAVNAVKTGEEIATTITLTDNASGNGVVVQSGKKIIFDLKTFTYTVDGETVGSTGTETNGFQLLKDSEVVFTNGSINSGKAKILIQNYSNLTLDKVTLAGGNATQYTLSNNNGKTVIKKGTSILAGAASPQAAFDVCGFSNYPGCEVTVAEDAGKIQGNIELSSDSAKHDLKLNIKGGDLTEAKMVAGSGAEQVKVVKADGVEIAAPIGFKWIGGVLVHVDGKEVAAATNADGTVSVYGSVSDALNVDGVNRVTLLKPHTENVVIPNGKNVVLDLAGNTLTNNQGDTVTVEGGASLNIVDSGKNGAVDNITHGKAALSIAEGAKVTLDGGTFKRSAEKGTLAGNKPNGNSYYTILNKGNLTINDGTTVQLLLDDGKPAGYSSVIDNGWFNGAPTTEGYNAKLTINGGVIEGGKYLKNDSYGTMEINGGEIKNGANASVLNWNVLTVNGGKLAPADGAAGAIYNNKGGAPEKGIVEVKGGEFLTQGSQRPIFTSDDDNRSDSATITGGSFTTKPDEDYIASGFILSESNGVYTVSAYVPPVTPPTPSDKTEVEHNQDGSTTTTVTKPDGSQTITHETATGTESVVKKDEDGNVTSTEVSVSKQDAESGKVELPVEKSEPAADADKAPAVEVKVPATVTADKPVQVTVPVAKDDDSEPDYGIVVFAVDEDGNETVIPKCSVDKDGNVVFEATGDVTIKVVDNAKDMPDVKETDWFVGDVVDFATARGIVNGVALPDGSRVFDGYGRTSRGMFVAMLHNLELNPEAASEGSLADVPSDAFYADAAAWALEEGILSGVDMPDGTKQFQGGADVTREQVAVFLMRYAEALGMDVSKRAEIDFPDAGEVSSYARDAMSWAVANGLFTGDDVTGELNPTDGAARAEVAAVLMRFINLMYA